MKKKILCLTFIFAVVLSCSLLYINASEPVGRVEQNQAMLTPAPPSPTPLSPRASTSSPRCKISPPPSVMLWGQILQ